MTKQEYADLHTHYYKMSDGKLRATVGELGRKRYDHHNIEVYAEHRIACRVLLERARDGTGLVFHLKELQPRKSC